ncbi:MAG: hypothetical protein EBR32_00780 [Bacteroidetes bacterium]|nr:hypothetical protein [Bacteroidota bacterium]
MKLLCLFLISWFLLSCSREPDIDRDFQVLFKVDDIEITVYEFESSYVNHLISTGKNDTEDERNTHLSKMIDDILLSKSAKEKGLMDQPIYLAAVDYQKRKSMIDSYFSDLLDEKLEPLTDDEIRLAYAKKQRKVYVRHLYSNNKIDIDQAYDSLQSGVNFIELANNFYQTSTYDSLAGYLGPISYFGVDDVFAEAAYSTNEGQYSEPIKTRLGYHIVYVEHIIFPAILAEDEYQYRKQGIESQLRLRKQQIISDNYVFELMSGLDVQTSNDNLIKLRDLISNLGNDIITQESNNPENADIIWTDKRIEQLANSFDRNAVLATYILDNQIQVFTFGEYLSWLPYLSFQESKLRLGASVGRGLRNQVLYQLSKKNGYEQDDRVKRKVDLRAVEILSELNQYSLTMRAIFDTSSIVVPEAFRNRLISSKEILLRASYWKIPAQDIDEAILIKDKIDAGENPSNFEGFQIIDYRTIVQNESDYSLVKKSLLNTPVVAKSSEFGWLIINVKERNITDIATETKMDDLERSFKAYASIQKEIDSLRTHSYIEIDTTLFYDIANLWSPTNK